LEGIFSRGDRRLLEVLMEARRMGAKFDAWGEHFRMGIWEEAFRRAGIKPWSYLHRERSQEEVMPWDHIRSGVRKAFLLKELKKSQRAETTPDCRETCLECGVCDHNAVDPILHRNWTLVDSPDKPCDLSMPSSSARIYRLTFTKLAQARYLSHLELVRVFVRAFKRAGLHLVYSKGFHPMPKLRFGSALPLGTESMHETLDVEVLESSKNPGLKRRINRQLPYGIAVTSIEEISPHQRKQQIKESHFVIRLNGTRLDASRLEGFLNADYFPVVKASKKGEHTVNARPLVGRMSRLSPNGIRLIMKHTAGSGLKPDEIARSVFSLSGDCADGMKILKTKQVLG
jgi:radical SAM-linked protein